MSQQSDNREAAAMAVFYSAMELGDVVATAAPTAAIRAAVTVRLTPDIASAVENAAFAWMSDTTIDAIARAAFEAAGFIVTD